MLPQKINFIPKHTFYHSNGVGRDLYISKDSGGVFQNNTRMIFADTSSGAIGNKIARKMFHQPFDRTVHYPPDGTGRDSYILTNEGGLTPAIMPTYQQTPKHYLKSLRNYQRSDIWRGQEKDYFSAANSLLNRQDQIKNFKLLKNQQSLVLRLSSTKNMQPCKHLLMENSYDFNQNSPKIPKIRNSFKNQFKEFKEDQKQQYYLNSMPNYQSSILMKNQKKPQL